MGPCSSLEFAVSPKPERHGTQSSPQLPVLEKLVLIPDVWELNRYQSGHCHRVPTNGLCSSPEVT